MVNNDSSADLEQQTIGVAVNDHIYSISAATTRKKFAAVRQGLSRRKPDANLPGSVDTLGLGRAEAPPEPKTSNGDTSIAPQQKKTHQP